MNLMEMRLISNKKWGEKLNNAPKGHVGNQRPWAQ